VKLHCRSDSSNPPQWEHIQADTGKKVFIFVDKLLSERFFLLTDEEGDFSIVLNEVQEDDAGTYLCLEDRGYGNRYNITLTVQRT